MSASAKSGTQHEAKKPLKPLFVVKPNTISRSDINRAEREAGICIIECSDPESARFHERPAKR